MSSPAQGDRRERADVDVGVHWGLAEAAVLHPLGHADHTCHDSLITATSPSDNDSTALTAGHPQRGGQVTCPPLSGTEGSDQAFGLHGHPRGLLDTSPSGSRDLEGRQTQDYLQVLGFVFPP